MKRYDRLVQVVGVLQDAEMPLPPRIIGGRVGLKVTPYLRGLLQELRDMNIIEKEERQLTNGLPVHLWKITDGAREQL